jgi:hypothetical protein
VCEKRDVHRFELHGKSANMLFELESSLQRMNTGTIAWRCFHYHETLPRVSTYEFRRGFCTFAKLITVFLLIILLGMQLRM